MTEEKKQEKRRDEICADIILKESGLCEDFTRWAKRVWKAYKTDPADFTCHVADYIKKELWKIEEILEKELDIPQE